MKRTEIINYLIETNGYTDYLEIGVYDPTVNFNKINCKNKVAVDPEPNANFIIGKTSDQFFEDNIKQFDIIFIDGLHEADQVKRDIENSLECLKPNGTIVVHDCNPTTEIMQKVPREAGEWTGDVWKAWLHFRQFADLSMFVLDTDYGVGIIRRGKQQPLLFVPRVYSLFEKQKKELLNLISIKPDPVSICIPAFEQYGQGARTLKTLLKTIIQQTGVDYQVVVSDNAPDDTIKKVCKNYPVDYVRNPVRGISANTNHALKFARYNNVKIMYQDDGFIIPDALSKISMALKFHPWVICSGYIINEAGFYVRKVNPRWTDNILETGKNFVGMPSVVAHRKNDFRFDEQLKVLLDAEFYWWLKHNTGNPGYIKDPVIGSRLWHFSTSSQQDNNKFLLEEITYLKLKYQNEKVSP